MVAVLACADGQQPRVVQVQAAEQRDLLDQLAVDRGQLAVARHLDQPVMELQVQQVVGVSSWAFTARFHRADQAVRLLALRRVHALGQPAADGVRPSRRAGRRSRSPRRSGCRARTRRGSSRCAPGRLRRACGRPRAPARATRPGAAPARLGELGARRELAGQDRALDLLLHDHRQRMVLQQGDGRVRVRAHARIGTTKAKIVNNLQKTIDKIPACPVQSDPCRRGACCRRPRNPLTGKRFSPWTETRSC
jgi:hypothetical protein